MSAVQQTHYVILIGNERLYTLGPLEATTLLGWLPPVNTSKKKKGLRRKLRSWRFFNHE